MLRFPDSMEIDAVEIHVIINSDNTGALFAVLESLNAWNWFIVILC